MKERWRAVVGWEGLYEVSDHGRVRSLDRVVQLSNRSCCYRGRVLRLQIKGPPKKKYYKACLSRPGERPRWHSVHRLVLAAFKRAPKSKEVARHKDGNRFNNFYKNLVWGTHKQNVQDTIRHGRTTRGTRNAQSKLTVQQVRAIRGATGSQSAIAARYGITQTTVSQNQTA